MTEQAVSLPSILTDLYEYNEKLDAQFKDEVRGEAVRIARVRCQERDSVLVDCLRGGRGRGVRGTLLRMLCTNRRIDPKKAQRTSPMKTADAKHAERWRALIVELGIASGRALELVSEAKPYKALGAPLRKTIDKLLHEVAAEQARLFEKPKTELLKPFWDKAIAAVRKRHMDAGTPCEKSQGWPSAVRWVADKVGSAVADVEPHLRVFCQRLANERRLTRTKPGSGVEEGRSGHVLAKRRPHDKHGAVLAGEIARLDTQDNVTELLRLFWNRWPEECLVIPLPDPTEQSWRGQGGSVDQELDGSSPSLAYFFRLLYHLRRKERWDENRRRWGHRISPWLFVVQQIEKHSGIMSSDVEAYIIACGREEKPSTYVARELHKWWNREGGRALVAGFSQVFPEVAEKMSLPTAEELSTRTQSNSPPEDDPFYPAGAYAEYVGSDRLGHAKDIRRNKVGKANHYSWRDAHRKWPHLVPKDLPATERP